MSKEACWWKNKSYHWDLDQPYVVATWSTFICNNLKVLKEMLPQSISFTGLPECLPCLISIPPLCIALSFWGSDPANCIFWTLLPTHFLLGPAKKHWNVMNTRKGRGFIIPVCYSHWHYLGSDISPLWEQFVLTITVDFNCQLL